MYIGQVVKAKQPVIRTDNYNIGNSKRKRIVKGKIIYITKKGLIVLDLGKYKESFYKEDIEEV